MTAQNADRRRPAGGDVDEDCGPILARTGDLDEAVAELVCGPSPWPWLVFTSGWSGGYAAGDAAGYDRAMRVLDEAGALLAATRPSRAIDAAAARRRRTEYASRPETAQQVQARARSSWARVERQVEPDPRKREAAERRADAERWRADRRPAGGRRAG